MSEAESDRDFFEESYAKKWGVSLAGVKEQRNGEGYSDTYTQISYEDFKEGWEAAFRFMRVERSL